MTSNLDVALIGKENEMRRYAQNSPQAAARIVALTIIADGDVDKAEFALLDRLAVHEQLGVWAAETRVLTDNAM
jgi:hypothetical protein